eukprot:6198171-Pleurochrysis_carterae.AAC.4
MVGVPSASRGDCSTVAGRIVETARPWTRGKVASTANSKAATAGLQQMPDTITSNPAGGLKSTTA